MACARLALGDAKRAVALALGEGPGVRAGAEAFARATVRNDLVARPWIEVLAQARARGERALAEVEAAGAAELELVPKKERRRIERETGERAKRAHRRAQTAGLDEALALVGLWFRDLACIADGAPELVAHSDRGEQLREDAAGRSAHRLRDAQQQVDDARAAFELNPSEELLLEALAVRLADTLRPR
jgi:DNA polymerase-3 subunit delta'